MANQITALSEQKDEVGNLIKSMKRNITWKFLINEAPVILELNYANQIFHKKKILRVNGFLEIESKDEPFLYKFKKDGVSLLISECEKEFYLFINDLPFKFYYKKIGITEEKPTSDEKKTSKKEFLENSLDKEESKSEELILNKKKLVKPKKLFESDSDDEKNMEQLKFEPDIKEIEKRLLQIDRSVEEDVLASTDSIKILPNSNNAGLNNKGIKAISDKKLIINEEGNSNKNINRFENAESKSIQITAKPKSPEKRDPTIELLENLRENLELINGMLDNCRTAHECLKNDVLLDLIEGLLSYETESNRIVMSAENEKTLELSLYVNDYINFIRLKHQNVSRGIILYPPPQMPPRNKTPESDEETCVICMNARPTHAALPCGHLRYCETCSKLLLKKNECAICRTPLKSINRMNY